MKVITKYPIYVNNERKAGASEFIYFDGKTASSADVLAFQRFANSKGYTPKLVEDGVYGAKTQAAIQVWGAEFDQNRSIGPIGGSGSSGSGSTPVLKQTTTSTPANNSNLSISSPSGQTKAGYYYDKVLGGFVKAKESGLLDTVMGLFGLAGHPSNEPTTTGSGQGAGNSTSFNDPNQKPEKKKIPTWVWIAGAAVLVGGVVMVVRSKKKGK